jgi:hypothetical protein
MHLSNLSDQCLVLKENVPKYYYKYFMIIILREEHRLRAFENRILRRIFVPKRKEGVGGCRRQHNEELCILCTLPNIIRVIKSRMRRWAGHVWEELEMHTVFWLENLKGRDHLEDICINGKII